MNKIRPYYTGRINSLFRRLQAERQRRFRAMLDSMTLGQQIKFLGEKVDEWNRLRRFDHSMGHSMKIIINMGDMTNGCPSITKWPMVSTVP